MGACTFTHYVRRAKAKTAKDAFTKAVEDAAWEHGHGGYTGTIAEKRSYKIIGTASTFEEAYDKVANLIDAGDPRISDKWGPAGCIEVSGDDGGYLFFGWASS